MNIEKELAALTSDQALPAPMNLPQTFAPPQALAEEDLGRFFLSGSASQIHFFVVLSPKLVAMNRVAAKLPLGL